MTPTTEGINQVIKNNKDKIEVGKISDGYHTFDELYDHRYVLWIKLCKFYNYTSSEFPDINGWIWKSKKHSDGSEYEGWFLLGLIDNTQEEGKQQLTYHLPMKYWDLCDFHVLDKAPEFDGHTSTDVLERLKQL